MGATVKPEAAAPADAVRPPTPPVATVTPDDVSAALASASVSYRLTARTTAPTWLRVRTDDGRQVDENIPAGEVREWVSNRPFTITVGNAAGVKLELNGRPLPPLGAPGAVVTRLVAPSEAP